MTTFYDRQPVENRGTYEAIGSTEEATKKRCEIVQWMLTHVKGKSNRTVLDVGCGYGDLYDYLSEWGFYTGLDSVDWVVEEARRRLPHGTDLIHGDVLDRALFEPNQYDYVIALGVLATVPVHEVTTFVHRLQLIAREGLLVSYLRAEDYPQADREVEGFTSFTEEEIEYIFGKWPFKIRQDQPGGVTTFLLCEL